MNATVGPSAWVPQREIATGSIRTIVKLSTAYSGDLPAHMLEHRAEKHGTEDEERDAVERRPGLLGETHRRRNVLAGDQAEQRSCHERGDEPRPPEVVRDPVREHRGGHRDDLPPGIVDQMPSSGHVHDRGGEDARCDAAEQSVADLLGHHAQRVGLAPPETVASTINNRGTQIPSLRPLSTLSD